MAEVLDQYRPEALSIEKLFYQHNQTTVIGVAEARRVILLAAARERRAHFLNTPHAGEAVGQRLRHDQQKQVQEMTRILLHLDKVPKPDDTADALAMAITHCHCSRSRIQGLPIR